MIKKGYKVMILSGKDKKKEGEVIELDRRQNRAKVKDINMVKKHVKTTKEKKGGIMMKKIKIQKKVLKNNVSEIKRNIYKRNTIFIKKSIWIQKFFYGSKN